MKEAEQRLDEAFAVRALFAVAEKELEINEQFNEATAERFFHRYEKSQGIQFETNSKTTQSFYTVYFDEGNFGKTLQIMKHTKLTNNPILYSETLILIESQEGKSQVLLKDDKHPDGYLNSMANWEAAYRFIEGINLVKINL